MARPSAPLIISCIALFVALSGTGYAVSQLPKNSVTAKQIKKGAVTSVKVKDRSLLAIDFKAGQLPAGAQGERGRDGATGPAGPTHVAFARVPDVVAITPSNTNVTLLTTPSTAGSGNPGPMVLTETSIVVLSATVPAINSGSATELSCEVATSLNGQAFAGLSESYPVDTTGSGNVLTHSFSEPVTLAPGTYRFRLLCEATSTSVLVLNNATFSAIATPL